jgi:hypothetical protein
LDTILVDFILSVLVSILVSVLLENDDGTFNTATNFGVDEQKPDPIVIGNFNYENIISNQFF